MAFSSMENSLENSVRALQVAIETAELQINNLLRKVDLIESKIINDGKGYVRQLFEDIEDVNEEIKSLKYSEEETISLQEINRNLIGNLNAELDNISNSLTNSL